MIQNEDDMSNTIENIIMDTNNDNRNKACKKPPLVVLTGPTAVGKTELSIRLAKAINAEIISADSMQVYKTMDIGTAKINTDEMAGIKHYLIDCIEPEDEFNIVLFQKMAKEAIDEIYDKGKIPLIVGGTGFYIQAVLNDIDFEADTKDADADSEFRASMRSIAKEKGSEYLHSMLSKVDPAAAEAIHHNNIKRVIRALEYYEQTGERISKHNEEQRIKTSPYNYVYFVLNDDRDILYERIDKRVDIMFENGLEAETEALIKQGLTREHTSMQGIGYKEMFGYFDNQYDLLKAKEMIKADTRHFAKRQLTWFRREKDVTWINYPDYSYDKNKMLDDMVKLIKTKGIIR